ncbi:transcriptional repressor [Vibrio sp. MarTm2]|uniref:Fur family transcriptional regulator n=1 Tax=Vibrio sp. MarTm2 TaxID=2998831 RepID=UPI0022CD7C84|nr:transcriptional repressor [Vibrio sp. MarTm2]MDA0128083.1 transcriptional repressor [Vibrio sp. MarTm2]
MRNEELIERVKAECKQQGKQLTAKRQLVLHALLKADQAMSAYEIVDYCQQEMGHSIQAMSVYRILEFLEDLKLVHKIQASNKFIVCAHIECEHEHGTPQFFICSKCNKISEQMVDPSLMSGLQNHARQQGFTVIQPQIEINCVCDECLKSS